jgi:hypothetical protein
MGDNNCDPEQYCLNMGMELCRISVVHRYVEGVLIYNEDTKYKSLKCGNEPSFKDENLFKFGYYDIDEANSVGYKTVGTYLSYPNRVYNGINNYNLIENKYLDVSDCTNVYTYDVYDNEMGDTEVLEIYEGFSEEQCKDFCNILDNCETVRIAKTDGKCWLMTKANPGFPDLVSDSTFKTFLLNNIKIVPTYDEYDNKGSTGSQIANYVNLSEEECKSICTSLKDICFGVAFSKLEVRCWLLRSDGDLVDDTNLKTVLRTNQKSVLNRGICMESFNVSISSYSQ